MSFKTGIPNGFKIIVMIVVMMVVLGFGLQAQTQTTTSSPTPTPTPSPAPQPKVSVGIMPAEDRWITLTDGSHIYEGLEVSYLLGQRLFDSQNFVPVMLTQDPTLQAPLNTAQVMHAVIPASATTSTPSMASASAGSVSGARWSQIPKAWMQWTSEPEVLSASAAVLQGVAVSGAPAQTSVHALDASTAPSPAPSFPVYVDVTVTPVIETLIYASGQRSDRVVFGFSPDHLNPFNQGRAGSLDNEYVASPTQQQTCVLPDFFDGALNPSGWGPFTGNFGSNLDEGASFDILGFGFGFKKKHYDVVSQIRFIIDNHMTGQHNELVFQTKAAGYDVMIDGSYAGFELGIEIQRSTTLVNALQQILPQIVDNLIANGMGTVWENSVIATSPQLTMGAGVDEGVTAGLQLQSPFGAVYQVIQVGATTSTLQKISGLTSPFAGEPLRVYTGQTIQWTSSSSGPAAQLVAKRALNSVAAGSASASASSAVSTTASGSSATGVSSAAGATTSTGAEKIFQASMSIPLNTVQRATAQASQTQACFGKSTGWVVQTIDFLFELYAWWKYDNIFDQSPHQNLPVVGTSVTGTPTGTSSGASTGTSDPASGMSTLASTSSGTLLSAPRIALIDSGVDYNDGALQSHFLGVAARQVFGFDFISWDTRPSDDNGHGTAAAKLLAQSTKQNFVLIPIKVIGSHGETHSSAVYDGFNYAVTNHADAILVPWSSQASTLSAYQMGAQMAAAAGIPVFVAPETVAAGTNIHAPVVSSSQKGFKTGGLGGASVQLDPDGVATVQLLAQWLQSQGLGGSNVQTK